MPAYFAHPGPAPSRIPLPMRQDASGLIQNPFSEAPRRVRPKARTKTTWTKAEAGDVPIHFRPTNADSVSPLHTGRFQYVSASLRLREIRGKGLPPGQSTPGLQNQTKRSYVQYCLVTTIERGSIARENLPTTSQKAEVVFVNQR